MDEPSRRISANQLEGLLLGTALGDSLGLPAEGLRPEAIARRWPGPWRHHFLFGRGMMSDDTEHAVLVAQALLASGDCARDFGRRLGANLRWWFACLPAGMGLATARACLKLWLGVSPAKSGVYSAGNGPAMRSPLLGAWFAHDPDQLREFVLASTRLTHTDPKAATGALAVALLAAWTVNHPGENPDPAEIIPLLRALDQDPQWQQLMAAVASAAQAGTSVQEFARSQGWTKGVSGYIFHTVAAVLCGWFRHYSNFRTGLEDIIRSGGDADTGGAILGGLLGLAAGRAKLPGEWVAGFRDWPRSGTYLQRLGNRLAEQSSQSRPLGPLPCFWPGLPFRNLFFLIIVLGHGFGRLVPTGTRPKPGGQPG